MQVRGFTLVEMVMTMVVGSILILGIAGFVELGSRGYSDTVNRQRLQTQAQFVLEKMTREVRHAVPNSFSTNNGCLSFYPIVYSGFYSVDGTDNTKLSIMVGNSSYDLTTSNLKMIINPTSAEEFSSGIDLASRLNTADMTVSLSSPLTSQSIASRFYIYSNAVEYCLDTLTGFVSRNEAGQEYRVANNVSYGALRYLEPTLQRGGVVHLALTFTQNDESSHFETDVQVLNVP